jgi:hypothetical protein
MRQEGVKRKRWDTLQCPSSTGSLNLALLPVLAFDAVRKVTGHPILSAKEKKENFPETHRNGSNVKLDPDPARAKAKARAKGKGKRKPEETETGKGKATAGNHLAPIGPKGMATASGATIVALLMMDLREEKERHRHHWQRKVL